MPLELLVLKKKKKPFAQNYDRLFEKNNNNYTNKYNRKS